MNDTTRHTLIGIAAVVGIGSVAGGAYLMITNRWGDTQNDSDKSKTSRMWLVGLLLVVVGAGCLLGALYFMLFVLAESAPKPQRLA
jgi:hypothetical protein